MELTSTMAIESCIRNVLYRFRGKSMRPSGAPQELERRRFRSLVSLREGLSPVEVARRVGVDRRSVCRCKAAAPAREPRAGGAPRSWSSAASPNGPNDNVRVEKIISSDSAPPAPAQLLNLGHKLFFINIR